MYLTTMSSVCFLVTKQMLGHQENSKKKKGTDAKKKKKKNEIIEHQPVLNSIVDESIDLA